MARAPKYHKIVIGRTELIDFVDLATDPIPAKVDTGAYSSSVHASDVSLDGDVLTFTLFGGLPFRNITPVTCSTKEFSQVVVSNSFGESERRFSVVLKVKLGPKVFKAPFTLANRSRKAYPILLGRTLLSGRFIVDTDTVALGASELMKTYSISVPIDEEGGSE